MQLFPRKIIYYLTLINPEVLTFLDELPLNLIITCHRNYSPLGNYDPLRHIQSRRLDIMMHENKMADLKKHG
jgi:hypothetical protein